MASSSSSSSSTTTTSTTTTIKKSPPPPPILELHLLGTGTSSGVPSIHCLTSIEKGCLGCRSTLGALPGEESFKNVRKNTGAILRIPPPPPSTSTTTLDSTTGKEDDSSWKTILIDCGKTFYSSALLHWPHHNLSRIDALLITHAHADAFFGLDDLRGWTLNGSIQNSIDIYVTKETKEEIGKCFPYLVDEGKATGGGDVPSFNWIIFDPEKTFELFGIEIVPLPVHHGKIFNSPKKQQQNNKKNSSSTSSEEEIKQDVVELNQSDHETTTITLSQQNNNNNNNLEDKKEEKVEIEEEIPYWSLGFLFDQKIVYISDVSYIPETTWSKLDKYLTLPTTHSTHSTTNNNNNKNLSIKPKKTSPAAIFIIDCLRSTSFLSHFGLGETISTIRRLGAKKNYLIGFSHGTSHETWVKTCERLSKGERSTSSSRTRRRMTSDKDDERNRVGEMMKRNEEEEEEEEEVEEGILEQVLKPYPPIPLSSKTPTPPTTPTPTTTTTTTTTTTKNDHHHFNKFTNDDDGDIKIQVELKKRQHLKPFPSENWKVISGSFKPGEEDAEMHAQWSMKIIEAFEPIDDDFDDDFNEEVEEGGGVVGVRRKKMMNWVRPGVDGMVIQILGKEEEEEESWEVIDDVYQ